MTEINSKPLMKAVVSGANGFIGSHLVQALQQKGYFVDCLIRQGCDLDNLKDIDDRNISFNYAYLDNKNSLEKAVADADLVFHVAGAVKGNFHQLYNTNVEGTKNIYLATRNKDIKRFVYVSSLAAVGPSNGIPLNEEMLCQPITNYGNSKKEAEEWLKVLNIIPTTIIRPPAVYGPRDKEVLTAFKAVKKGIALKIGKGKQRINMIYVDDLVDGMIKAAENEKAAGETYFLAHEKDFSWGDFNNAIGSSLEKTPVSIKIPVGVAYAIGYCNEKILETFGKSAMLSAQKINELKESWVCSSEKAKEDFGFVAKTSLEEGVRKTAKWYSEKGWL